MANKNRLTLAVRLPTDRSARRNEALHELAWRDLLELVPGTLSRLLTLAPLPAGASAISLATGVRIGFAGGCGSDLFVTCAACELERAVIEIKGPTASMNLGIDGWQTDVYRSKYVNGISMACQCVVREPVPLLFLLDARDRNRHSIERTEGCHYPLDLSKWVVLPYSSVLQVAPFAGHALAAWLTGR
ncbi:hypothetical protein O2V63_10570 [Modestobacter sp. VKM Ac-2977]|uniref:hypothetical protein n=1 Tax=Modestobacter sp. VKM Ac-2977 TaxID=3004131 RepID=UPI0022AA124F|nr:hypothetical protein [Modestobacter sp. VKM Ac-2977]MCZ2820773.1 hypothetical protein [Modestobacter sp. VKM Ac-2977]